MRKKNPNHQVRIVSHLLITLLSFYKYNPATHFKVEVKEKIKSCICLSNHQATNIGTPYLMTNNN